MIYWTIVCSPRSLKNTVLAKVFLIMISIDMPDCHEEAESIIFVDDDTDSVSTKKPEDLVERL